jgi:hypothetical protein
MKIDRRHYKVTPVYPVPVPRGAAGATLEWQTTDPPAAEIVVADRAGKELARVPCRVRFLGTETIVRPGDC